MNYIKDKCQPNPLNADRKPFGGDNMKTNEKQLKIRKICFTISGGECICRTWKTLVS